MNSICPSVRLSSGFRFRLFLLLSLLILSSAPLLSAAASPADGGGDGEDKIVVAYVTSWSDVIPNPHYMTHLNYAFGHVADSFDSVRIDNPSRFRRMAKLKRENSRLKVLLSIGGWGSGRFSEMAADPALRRSFARSCRKVVDDYGIDGIDIDWEYPGSNAAGISSSAADPENFVKLLHDLREALGSDRLLTIASGAWGNGCLFKDFIDDVDFVNVMTYDMASAPRHHSPLHKSPNTGDMVVDTAIDTHLTAGVPADKLTLGVPFYGRGAAPYGNFVNYADLTVRPGCEEKWDATAMAPYIADADGKLLVGYDNGRSMALKCDYVRERGLKGMMYWDYSGDRDDNELRSTIADRMLPSRYPADYARAPRFKALLYYSDKAEPAHVDFARQSIEYFHRLSYGEGYILDRTTSLADYPYERLKEYDVMIVINTMPFSKAEREAFELYMENGGGWIGFHAAGYNDANTHWDWFNNFLGAGKFYCNTWPPQPALLDVNTAGHDVTKNLPSSFVAPECEWYQWRPAPGDNKDVKVLLSLSPKNYPIGLKDIVYYGDFPVVWTNRRYRMIYLNIGHGDTEYSDPTQNLLIVNAFRWVVSRSPEGNPFMKG